MSHPLWSLTPGQAQAMVLERMKQRKKLQKVRARRERLAQERQNNLSKEV